MFAIVSLSQDPGRKWDYWTGDDWTPRPTFGWLFKDEEEVHKFLKANGCTYNGWLNFEGRHVFLWQITELSKRTKNILKNS